MSLSQGMLSPPPPVYDDDGSMVPVYILQFYLTFLASGCVAFIIYICYMCYNVTIHPSEHQHDIELGLPRTTPSQDRAQEAAAAEKSLTWEEQEQLAFKEVAWSVCRDKTCSICFREFEDEDKCKARAECNHTFHRDCIDEWLTRRKECPLCRGYVWCPSANT